MAAWYDIAAEAPWLVNPPQQTSDPRAPNFLESFKQGQVDALQMQALKDKVAEGHLDLAANIEGQKAKNQMKAGIVAFGQAFNSVSKLKDKWADPEAESMMGTLLQEHPELANNPIFKETQNWIQTAQKAKADLDIRKQNADTNRLKLDSVDRRIKQMVDNEALAKQMTPEQKAQRVVELQDEYQLNGKLIPQDKEAKPTAFSEDTKVIADAKQEYEDALQSGDPARLKKAKSLWEAIQLKLPQSERFSGYDANGNLIFSFNRGPGGDMGTMPGTATQAQEAISGFRQSITQLKDLAGNLRDKDVGIAGVAGEFFGDRLIPQFDPSGSTKDPVRVKNRTELKAAVEGLIGQLTSHKRVSNQDRKELESIAPSTGAWETGDRARQSAVVLGDIIKKRAQDAALNAKQPIEDWMLTADQIRAKFSLHQMTEEQATALIEQNYPGVFKK